MNTGPYNSTHIAMRQGGWRVQKATEKGRPSQFVKTVMGRAYLVSSSKSDGSEWRITKMSMATNTYFGSWVDIGAPRFASPMECAVWLELNL